MIINRSHNGPIYAGTVFSLSTVNNFNEPLPDVDLALVTSWRNEDGHVLREDNIDVIVSNGRGHTSFFIYSPIHTTDSGRVSVTVTVSALNESLQMYIYPVNTLASVIINVEGI